MKVVSEGGLAVVTGAAGGLGSSFANKLAARGYQLLLVDRRRQPLDELCEAITARHGVATEAWVADLCERDEVEKLATRLEQTADAEVLVNNAGFGSIEHFVDAGAKSLLDMVDIHVAAPMRLTRAMLPRMMERNRGSIINMASVGAFVQSTGNVGYGSTKSFLTFFSMTLAQELRGTDIRVQALCPGFVRTAFHDATGMKGFTTKTIAGRLWMTADEVVECSLRRLNSKQVIVVPGLGYSVFVRLARMPLVQPLMRWFTHVPRLPMVPVAVVPAGAMEAASVTTSVVPSAAISASTITLSNEPAPGAEVCAVVSLTPNLAAAIEICPEPNFAVAELAESMTAS
jgi:short-subunit dehydrogenase